MHVPCRVVFRNVERFKIKEIKLYLGPLYNLKTKAGKYINYFISYNGDRMSASQVHLSSRKGDIYRVFGDLQVARCSLHLGQRLLYLFLQLVLEGVNERSNCSTFTLWYIFKQLYQLGQGPVTAEIAAFKLIYISFI